MTIERIERQPVDDDRTKALRELFPEVLADGRVNVDRLRELLEGAADESSDEHYGLNWPGKQAARKQAAKAPNGTLRPAPGEGFAESTTRNLLIVGDNLECLRQLQKSYAGRIKLIYIDPPYNTGSDFIYKDDFADPVGAYLEATGQADLTGLLTSNPRSGGRFHSRWLSMMLPRLLLARTLLSEEGLIAVSIDDHEVHALRLLLDEVFGEENFLAQIIWHNEGHTDNQYDIKVTHEYIVLYARDMDRLELGYIVDPNTRAESNLWKGFAENSITKNGPGNPASEVCLPIGFPCAISNLDLPASGVSEKFFRAVQANNRVISRELTKKFDAEYPVRLDPMKVRDGALVEPCRVYSGWGNRDKLVEFIHGGCAPLSDASGASMKFYLSKKGVIYYRKDRPAARNIVSVWRNLGTTERMRADLERIGVHFSYPKPDELVQYLIRVAGVSHGHLVLDFFAGSGTTAEAVLKVNKEDGNERNFILVQLPEQTSRREHPTIADITKARLNSVAKTMTDGAQELPLLARAKSDVGFRVLYEDKSNVQRWIPYADTNPGTLVKLFRSHDGLVSGWKAENVLIEVMLLEGYPLDSTRAQSPDFLDNVVYVVEHASIPARLLVCLDSEIAEGTVEKLAEFEKDTFVCCEAALTDTIKMRVADTLHRVRTL